jgi:hypothetical protein
MFAGRIMAGNLFNMYRFTGIARMIDLRYPSNRYAVIATLVASGLAFVLTDFDSVPMAIAVGGSTFLAWATAREIDPDRTLSATIAAPVAAAAAWLAEDQGSGVSLGALWLLLLATRITVRTTGVPPTRLDLALHVGVAVWVALDPYAWPAALVLAVAVVRDTRLIDPAPSENLWWGAAIGVLASIVAGTAGPGEWSAPSPTLSALLAAGLIGTAILVRPQGVESTTDSGSKPIEPIRLAMGRLILGLGAAMLAVIGGAGGVAAVAPVWATLAVAAAVRLARR